MQSVYHINSFIISSVKQFLLFETLKITRCSVDNCKPPLFVYTSNIITLLLVCYTLKLLIAAGSLIQARYPIEAGSRLLFRQNKKYW